MFNLFKRLNPIRKFEPIVGQINKLSEDIAKLDKEAFTLKTKELKDKIAAGENADKYCPRLLPYVARRPQELFINDTTTCSFWEV